MWYIQFCLIFSLFLTLVNLTSAADVTYYLTALKVSPSRPSQQELILQITTTSLINSPVNFTVEIPGLNWTTSSNCTYGQFTEVDTPDVVTLNAGKRGIIITPQNREHLVILGKSLRSISDVFQSFPNLVGTSENVYFSINYGNNRSEDIDVALINLVGHEDNTAVNISFQNLELSAQFGFIVLETKDEMAFLDPITDNTISVILNRGDTLEIAYEGLDLTGTKIVTSSPVTFLSGHQCPFIPEPLSSCSQIVEELPPVEYWGREFVAVPIAERTSYDILRAMAAFDNTTITFQCTNGSTSMLNLMAGEFKDVRLTSDVSCGISSNQKVLMVQYCVAYTVDVKAGNPFLSLLLPTAWYYNEAFIYAYLTRSSINVYRSQYINLVVPEEFHNQSNIFIDETALEDITPSAVFEIELNSKRYHGYQIPINQGSHHVRHKNGLARLAVNVYSLGITLSSGYTSLPLSLCLYPDPPENGRFTSVSEKEVYVYGDVIETSVECNPGFLLIPGDMLTCHQNGMWKGMEHLCEDVSLEIIVLGNVTIFGTGDDIQLDCSQSAGLNFSSWLKDEEIIPEFSTTLKIQNSTIQDSGMYTCIASTTSTSTEIYFNSSVSIKVIGPPSEPQGLLCNVTINSSALEWSVPDDLGNADPVDITYLLGLQADPRHPYNDLTSSIPEIPNEINETFLVINNLQPFTRYTFSVSAKNSFRTGGTAFCTYRTEEGVPKYPPSIIAMQSKSLHFSSIIISWRSPNPPLNGILSRYRIVLKDNVNNITREINGDVLVREIEDLEPFTEYIISVSAGTEGGFGPISETITITTLPKPVAGKPLLFPIEEIVRNIDFSSTRNTISLRIPQFTPPEGALLSHIWVVCGMDLHTGGQAPSRRFPPEVIFGSYNTSHYLNRAYIAAEIGIDSTLQPGTFVVGNGSVSYGTDGTMYYNGPLKPGQIYRCFIRYFYDINRPAELSVSALTFSERQYAVYESTNFITVSTKAFKNEKEFGGSIAGGIVGGITFLIIMLAAVILALYYYRKKKNKR